MMGRFGNQDSMRDVIAGTVNLADDLYSIVLSRVALLGQGVPKEVFPLRLASQAD
jgi:hypothetical protein